VSQYNSEGLTVKAYNLLPTVTRIPYRQVANDVRVDESQVNKVNEEDSSLQTFLVISECAQFITMWEGVFSPYNVITTFVYYCLKQNVRYIFLETFYLNT